MFGHINHLVLKVTRGCNLSCGYCYIKNKESFDKESIELKTVHKIIDRLVSDKKKNKDKMPVNITLHGGEPTKIGRKKFYQIVEYIDHTLSKEEIPFLLSTQSNLTLIDENFAQVLNRFDVSIGFSFDGIGGNSLRTTKFNDDFFLDKMRMFRKYKVDFAPLIVITKENYDKIFDTLDFLEKEFGIKNVRLNYAEDVITKKLSDSDNFEIKGSVFFEKIWKKVVDEFITDKIDNIYETNVERIIRKFVNYELLGKKDNEQGNCGLDFCGGGVRIIEVEPDGNISYCGRYSQPFEEAHIGHVDDLEFLDMKSYGRYFDFIKNKDEVIRNTGCDVCPAKHICDHGCMAFYYSKFGKWGVREDLICDLYIPMHNYLYENREKIINKTIQLKRDGDELDLNLGNRIFLKEGSDGNK